MYNDGIIQIDGVIAENISELTRRHSELSELRICELSELAREAADDSISMIAEGYTVLELLSVLGEGLLFIDMTTHSSCSEINRERIHNEQMMLNIRDKAVFSDFFSDRMKKNGVAVTEGTFLSEKNHGELFAYVKNPLADEAFDVFSESFANSRVQYTKTLSESAKRVSSGEASFCLLPLEERGGVRIAATSELIYKLDLKIDSVTPVFGYDGNADMKYALVSQSFVLPEVCAGDDRYLEIRFSQNSAIPPYELFCAAEMLGASLYRVNTISYATEDGMIPHYSVVFKSSGEFSKLLMFLTLFSGDYTPIGIYKNLE